MASLSKKYISSSRGNVGVIFGVSILAVGLGIGAAVDFTRLVSTDQKLQDAVDAATLYAATLPQTNDINADAQNYLASKVSALQIEGLSANFTKNSMGVTGTATGELPLVFGGLLSKDFSSVEAKTVVNLPSVSPCIVALSKTKSPGFLLNGGAKIESAGCEIHVHSEAAPAATINGGTLLDPSRTCIAGRSILNHSTNYENIETQCEAIGDPYAGRIPVPDSSNCDYSNEVWVDQEITLSPGVYCGWNNFQAVDMDVTFEPGVYVLRGGGWNANGGSWYGEGVTIYYADNSVLQFNSAVKAELSAPETGPYAGVFMAEAPGVDGSDFIINDSIGFDFEGVIHLPSRQVIFNGGVTVRSRELAIVADSIIINSASLSLEPHGGGTNTKRAYISE